MLPYKLIFLLFFLCYNVVSLSQENITVSYIQKYKYLAIKEMNEFRIPASIKLAQAILESGSGESKLAKKAKNHFGIKCHDWTGKTFYQDDDEMLNKITTSTLVTTGQNDVGSTKEMAINLSENIKNAKYAEIRKKKEFSRKQI